MKCSAQRKCQHCKEFYLPDRRNLHHQRYCAEPACRRQSKAESQRRWVQKSENQNYFSGSQNGGFCISPRKGPIQDHAAKAANGSDPDFSQFPNNFLQIDRPGAGARRRSRSALQCLQDHRRKSSSSGRCWIPAKDVRAVRTDALTAAVPGESAAHQVVEVIRESTENPGLNLFAGICKNPQNSQRVKEWRKRNPGYWRKKSPPPQEPLQDLCSTQVAQDEEVKRIEISDALQDVSVMQPAVMVGLISMMTGSALQEDIAATTRALLSKGQDILGQEALESQRRALSR